ncbi:formylglycine-generating enzyme family protein [Ralstonia flaminis]|jgi:sulfatase modifying factor 1|uniref:Formylglycine-generating enzyme n=1 Tax=Ralstonia flaminis TaxID=3058597 RepID=A0ABM9K566_9RALS|nr:formylglycine-generating enzyme family protein [Ralstonia sp. LMG 18101]CAJ0815722.1 Formylglycine-generating enzyme [Ralstonia sp. LMG 18101]
MGAVHSTRRVRWVLAGAALAAAGTVLLHPAGGNMAARAANVVGAHTTPRPPLGTANACAHYAGLPPGWRQDTRAGMVHVSSGSFTFGTTLGYPDERPAQGAGKTRVSGFWIDQTEVTNAQFATFVATTGYVTDAERQGGAVVFHVPDTAELQARPYAWWRWVKGADWRHPTGPDSKLIDVDNQPVTRVTQADALAYAHWLGRDLPTEAEWEYAGKAGQDGADLETAPRDGNGKPGANYWQGIFPVLDTAEDGHAGIGPVGCYAANGFALYDMIGNVWEWTRDAYTGPHQSHANGDTRAVAVLDQPQRFGQNSNQPNRPTVIKGGSFLCSPDFCVRYRASAREAQEADLPAAHIGFRTILRD